MFSLSKYFRSYLVRFSVHSHHYKQIRLCHHNLCLNERVWYCLLRLFHMCLTLCATFTNIRQFWALLLKSKWRNHHLVDHLGIFEYIYIYYNIYIQLFSLLHHRQAIFGGHRVWPTRTTSAIDWYLLPTCFNGFFSLCLVCPSSRSNDISHCL